MKSFSFFFCSGSGI